MATTPEYIYRVDGWLLDMPAADGYMVQAPIAYWAPLVVANKDMSTTYSGQATSEGIWGERIADYTHTLLSTTTGATGIVFAVATPAVSAYFSDLGVDPLSGKRRILYAGASPDGEARLVEIAEVPADHQRDVRIWLSQPPAGSSPTPATRYWYLSVWASGSTEIRIAIRHRQPMQLERRTSTGWEVIRSFGLMADELADSSGLITVSLTPDGDNLYVVINDKESLRHRIYVPGLKYRMAVTSRAYAYSIAVLRARRDHPTVRVRIPDVPPDARIISTSGPASGQVVTDELGTWIEAAVQAPLARDVAVYHPGRYVYLPPSFPVTRAEVRGYAEVQEWDDMAHLGRAYGTVAMDNTCGQLVEQGGVRTIVLGYGTQYGWGPRARGMIGHGVEGLQLLRADPVRSGQAMWSDAMSKLQEPLLYDLVLDGYALHAAVRLIAAACNIAHDWMQSIPDPGPPPYPDDYPYPVLGVGTYTSPRYRIEAGTPGIQAILRLLRDYGAYYTQDIWGRVHAYPYMLWFDPIGQLHLEPWMPEYQRPVAYYSSTAVEDPYWSVHQIIGQLEVINSVANIRTDVHVMGLDAQTFDLLYGHAENRANARLAGMRKQMLIRSPHVASEEQLELTMRLAAQQSDLTSQHIRFMAAADPYVHAGQVIVVDDALVGGAKPYAITRLETHIPPGVSTITARTLAESVSYTY